MTTPNEVAGLIERLRDRCTFEWKGLQQVRIPNLLCAQAADMLERLSPTEATEPLVEQKPVAWMYHHPGDLEQGWQRYSFERRIQSYEGMSCNEEDAGVIETPLYAALSSSISNAEAEDSGEVVQAGAKEPWEVLRDIVTPSPFSHNKAAWSIMLGLIQRDHRLAARQSPDSLVDALTKVITHGRLPNGVARSKWVQIPSNLYHEISGIVASLSNSPSDGERV